MSALDRLAGRLNEIPMGVEKLLKVNNSIDLIVSQLQKNVGAGNRTDIGEDLQIQAVHRFWQSPQFNTLKEARLVSFGLCIPSQPSGPCIMDDRSRFLAVLDRKTGVDQWLDDARWYRRCYQGLVRSFFTYDAKIETVSKIGRQNWGDLRDYLRERTRYTLHTSVNPDWVNTANRNSHLFGEDPCSSYAEALLNDKPEVIKQLCEQLGIIAASWFQRDLILAQVKYATMRSDDEFSRLIPRLIQILASNQVLRDRGLILVLDRYAKIPEPVLNQVLQDASVSWWGNPWLPSNEMRWGGVKPATREMVSDWLKREFIEAFFTKLAEDGVGDRRRVNFWIRYSKMMNNIQFALGTTALYSRDKDFVALREKMKGLVTELLTSDGSNNAFIMTLGELVAVEFSGSGNAFYGYDSSRNLPFKLSQPVVTAMNAKNSLKHDKRILKMSHTDNIKGYGKWEERFEETLKQEFSLTPKAIEYKKKIRRNQFPIVPQLDLGLKETARNTNISAANVQANVFNGPFSKELLIEFAKLHHLRVEDLSNKNGNLWVYTNQPDANVYQVLNNWGFAYKIGKGWWK